MRTQKITIVGHYLTALNKSYCISHAISAVSVPQNFFINFRPLFIDGVPQYHTSHKILENKRNCSVKKNHKFLKGSVRMCVCTYVCLWKKNYVSKKRSNN